MAECATDSRYQEGQENLEAFSEEKIKGIIIRAQAWWHEHGEKSTKYFFKLLKQLNQLLFKFLWKGADKVRRVSAINENGEGGLKMIDLETMVKSLKLAWLKQIFNGKDGTWKRYLKHQLKPVGLFFVTCNYDVNDYTISSQFYHKLLLWWSQFCGTFASESHWERIIWNNKEIQIDKKPLYF